LEFLKFSENLVFVILTLVVHRNLEFFTKILEFKTVVHMTEVGQFVSRNVPYDLRIDRLRAPLAVFNVAEHKTDVTCMRTIPQGAIHQTTLRHWVAGNFSKRKIVLRSNSPHGGYYIGEGENVIGVYGHHLLISLSDTNDRFYAARNFLKIFDALNGPPIHIVGSFTENADNRTVGRLINSLQQPCYFIGIFESHGLYLHILSYVVIYLPYTIRIPQFLTDCKC
jgi:hypothetical protein